ncbi:MAG: orotate phosphoribosyltransferase [Syntrophaceticus sp.]|jgi:orotate phosphoribosyltransferase|nr:orotate phosphoribosyltransferase [Syntrophaceticus sp.]
MTEQELIQVFKERGALLDGHFRLTSGLHSNRYIQCAQVLKYPDLSAELGKQLADHFRDLKVDTVVGPAVGGIIVAQEVGRGLGVKAIFSERVEGEMTLRRGFEISEGERVVVVEDVVTTGGSTKEVIELVKECGGVVVGVGSLVDRHSGELDFGVPFHPLLKLAIETYSPDDCPLCQKGLPVLKPGSRKS